MSYSLQQAATATGLNKSTVLRAIKAGKISASRDEHGQWVIEPAELHRVYPPAVAGNGKGNGARNDTHQPEIAEANQRAAVAEREAALLRATIDDLRLDRNAWREQAQRLALPAPMAARVAAARPWWWWRPRLNGAPALVTNDERRARLPELLRKAESSSLTLSDIRRGAEPPPRSD